MTNEEIVNAMNLNRGQLVMIPPGMKITQPEMKCETCRWWERHYTEAIEGVCRRGLPSNNNYGRGTWPSTDNVDWCGGWTARIPLPVTEELTYNDYLSKDFYPSKSLPTPSETVDE